MSSTLKQQLADRIKAAMKGGQKDELQYARTLSAAIKQVEIDTRTELADAQVVEIVAKLIKQRNESIEQAVKAGRAEMAANERAEKAFLETFMPPALTESELAELVTQAIAEVGATSPKEMGAVMKALSAKTAGRVDGKTLSAKVRDALAGTGH